MLNEIKKIPCLNRGDHINFQDKNNSSLTATAWKDTGKTPVQFISTFSTPDVVTHCVRRIGQTLTRVTHTYKKGYNFVDLFDLYRSKYKVGCNCKKSWKYIFYFLIDATIVSSYILYSQSSTCTTNVKRYDQFRFRLELGKSFIAGFSNRKRDHLWAQLPAPLDPANSGLNSHENVHM